MAKIIITDIQDTPGSVIPAINSKFQQVEDELQNKVLYRDNPTGEPNTMKQPLDMNGFDIVNVGNVTSGGLQSNVVVVQSLSDLPAPVGGVYTLAANTVYEVGNVTLNFGTDTIVLEDGANLRGAHRTESKLIYSGTGSFITCNGAAFFENLQIDGTDKANGATGIDTTGSSTGAVTLYSVFIRNWGKATNIKNRGVNSYRTCTSLNNTIGFEVGLGVTTVNATACYIIDLASDVGFNILSTSLNYLSITGNNRFSITNGRGIQLLALDANYSASGQGIIADCSFSITGTGTAVLNYNPVSDLRTRISTSIGVDDTKRGIQAFDLGTLTTTINTLGVPEPLAQTTPDISYNSGMTLNVDAAGSSYTYNGLQSLPLELKAEASIVRPSGTTGRTITLQWFKSTDGGTVWSSLNVNSAGEVSMDNRVRSIQTKLVTTANTGDRFKLYVSNLDDTTNIECRRLAVTIKEF